MVWWMKCIFLEASQLDLSLILILAVRPASISCLALHPGIATLPRFFIFFKALAQHQTELEHRQLNLSRPR